MSELDTRIALLLGEEVGTLEHHPKWLLSDSGGEVCARCNTYLDFDIYGAAREGFKNEPCSLFPKPRSRSLEAQQEILAGLRKRGWGFRWSYGDYIEAEAFRRTLNGSEEDHIRAEESDLPKTVATVILAALESEAKG